MKYHVLTALLLIAALPLYAAGLTGGGAVVLGLAVVLELWFWSRILRGNRG